MTRRQGRYRRVGAAGAAAGVVACVGLGAGGCSDSDAVVGGARLGDPVRALREAADRLTAAGSAKTRTSMQMASGGTRVTIRGKGVYDFAERIGRLKVMLPQDPAGSTDRRPITELLTPGALFMKNRGAGVPADKWVRVETESLSDGNLVTGGATDPLAAAEVLRGTREAEYVGRTELAGTPVHHYRGTADLLRAAEFAGRAVRTALRAAAEGFASADVPFDAYLDDEGRVRKVRHRFDFANGGPQGGRHTVAVASTTLLYDFGVPVTVRLPDEDDIYAGEIAEDAGAETGAGAGAGVGAKN
ncbi:hypothetical protein [Streptomyces sp. CRN 30]|uniref:hypothetical protein n=1 Tax=Streptomyces sp. CRN 30 TaxID=3075613 RepID=UPI002A81A66E|nr:hypothetical protein [Streptomyces sp. CRN 30]